MLSSCLLMWPAEWKEEELFMELPLSVRAEVADWLVCDILRQSLIFG